MAVKVKNGFPGYGRLVIVLSERRHGWHYDEKNVEEKEKVAVVVLWKETKSYEQKKRSHNTEASERHVYYLGRISKQCRAVTDIEIYQDCA